MSGVPKNYCYRVCCGGDENNTKTVCKVRGISLNTGNAHLVNMDTLTGMVVHDDATVQVPIPAKITRVNKFDVVTP